MSISDRLDWIEGRRTWANASLTARHMLIGEDVPALTAALRAVLDLCDETTLQCSPHSGSAPYMVVSANSVRATIAAVLGEEA